MINFYFDSHLDFDISIIEVTNSKVTFIYTCYWASCCLQNIKYFITVINEWSMFVINLCFSFLFFIFFYYPVRIRNNKWKRSKINNK